VKYAKQRRAFGKNIATSKPFSGCLPRCTWKLKPPAPFLYQAAWLKDAHPIRLGTPPAKQNFTAAKWPNRVAAKAVQIHGGVGYSRETR